MLKTRSSDSWDTKPGKFDTMNFQWMFESSTEQGIPDLQPTDFIPECLAAWNMPRHRQHAAETGGAIHFYLDDYRFETAWSAPERLLPRVLAVGASLTPDFSVWRDIPRASQIWNTYRSRWCGAFWQWNGVEVIPTVGWGAPDTYDFCFDGIPENSVVSVSDVGMKNIELDKALFRQGMRELIDRKRPKAILAYGQLRYCDSLDLPDVREYPTYWDRRRKQISEWESAEEGSEQDGKALLRLDSAQSECLEDHQVQVAALGAARAPLAEAQVRLGQAQAASKVATEEFHPVAAVLQIPTSLTHSQLNQSLQDNQFEHG